MKKLLLFFAVLFAIFVVGCQTDITSDHVVDADGVTTLTLSLPDTDTRTSLGEKVDDTYPVYWSEGDKISVNGVESLEAEIDATNPGKAQFTFGQAVNYPLNILYPSGSLVVFPAEQSYVEGSFAEGCAPMCGYVAQKSDKVELKHLAGLLRFPVKASAEGLTLQTIVITSKSAKLSGDFSVNCQNGTIVSSEKSANSVTYIANTSLSTTSEKVFYIAMPAIEVGDCTVEFIDSAGDKMTASWSGNTINAGVMREFKTITYTPNSVYTLIGFDVEEDKFMEHISYGYVRDTNGNPLSGAVVSDGLNCTQTNAEGYYELPTNFVTAKHIFVTIPSGYKAPKNEEGLPLFYHAITTEERIDRVCNANFEFEPIAGDANRFTMFVGADPQPRAKTTGYDRFAFHSLDICENFYLDLKESKAKITDREVYGLMLGDIVHENMSLYPYYTAGMQASGVQVFNVIGNHDHDYTATTERDGARVFESYFGPSYYSVNLGKIHLVVLDNLIMKIVDGKVNKSNYSYGLTDEEWTWLQNDMSYVDTNTTIMVAAHAPMFKTKSMGDYSTSSSTKHGADYAALFAKYKKVHAWAGHTHVTFNYNYPTTSTLKNLEVHTVARSTGELWTNEYCTSGTPRGYTVVEVDGDDVSWKFKPTIYQAEYIAPNYSYTTGSPAYTYRDWDFVDGVAKMKDTGKTLDDSYQMHGFAPGVHEDGYVYLHIYLWDDKWGTPTYNGTTMEHLKYNSSLSYNRAWKEMRQFYSTYCTTLSKNEDYAVHASITKTNNEHTIFRAPESKTSGSGTFTVTDRFGNTYSRTITW